MGVTISAQRAGYVFWGLLARLTSFALLLGVFLAGLQPAAAYGVLTHNQLVDQAWASGIVPLLLSRYPSLTAEQLREAHAFAYGGCLIQDFGYYPFADSFIAGLMHYVRSGDFVESLFHNAQNANELAFAIGALSHFIGDSIGHSAATNPSVALVFPKLKARYGPSVNYARTKGRTARLSWPLTPTNSPAAVWRPRSTFTRSVLPYRAGNLRRLSMRLTD